MTTKIQDMHILFAFKTIILPYDMEYSVYALLDVGSRFLIEISIERY